VLVLVLVCYKLTLTPSSKHGHDLMGVARAMANTFCLISLLYNNSAIIVGLGFM
jgi:hypothetical protein